MALVRSAVLLAMLLCACENAKRSPAHELTIQYDTTAGAQPAEKDRASLTPKALKMAMSEPENATMQVRERFWGRGYASCRVERKGNTLVVWAGPKVKLGRLRIEGSRWQREEER